MKGRNVFAVLPTGYLCFGCLPIVFNELLGGEGEDRSIVVAVYSPESYSVM